MSTYMEFFLEADRSGDTAYIMRRIFQASSYQEFDCAVNDRLSPMES
jgi:hypothetical protein